MNILTFTDKSGEEQFGGYDDPATAVKFRSGGTEAEKQDDMEPLKWDPEFMPPIPPPPVIQQPLFACSETIVLTGLMTGARVVLDVNGDKLEFQTLDGALTIEVPALDDGAQVRAIQEFDGSESKWSKTATVAAHPRRLPRPRLIGHPYECARFVVAENLFIGARARCEVNGSFGPVQIVKAKRQTITAPQALSKGDLVRVLITLCEKADVRTLEAVSDTRDVQPELSPLPIPIISKRGIVLGNDRIFIEQVLEGAHGKLSNLKTGDELFYRNRWESAWHSRTRPIRAGDEFTFENRLCKSGSPSDPVIVKEGDPDLGQLFKPTIARPFCPGNTIFTLYNCLPGARVGLLLDGRPVALAVAYAETVEIAIDPASPVQSGQVLRAFTYVVPGMVELSNEVEVLADNNVSITVDGAINYVNPDGSKRYGVDIVNSSHFFVKVRACCADAGEIGPVGIVLMNETPVTFDSRLHPVGDNCFAGYILPEEELPLGRYQVRVEGICGDRIESQELWTYRSTPGKRDQQSPQLSLTATTSDGARVTVSDQDRQSVPIISWFDEQFDVVLEAKDQSGLDTVEVSQSGLAQVQSTGLTRYSYQKQSPIPTDLLMRSNWIPSELGRLYLDAAAIDLTVFGQMSQTAQIEVEIKQRMPVLREINPNSAFWGATITLRGDFLNTRPQTTLLFIQMGVEKSRIDVTASSKRGEITSVTVPRLSPGQYEISVEAGPKPERSLSLPFQVKARPQVQPPKTQSKNVLLAFQKVVVFNGFSENGEIFFALDPSSFSNLSSSAFPFVGEITNKNSTYAYRLFYLEYDNSDWKIKKSEVFPVARNGTSSSETFKGLNVRNGLWVLKPGLPGGYYKEVHTLEFELFDRRP